MSLDIEIFPQRFHIEGKGLPTCIGNSAGGSRLLAVETFFDGDVARRGEFVDLNAQISRSRFGVLFQIDEIRLIDIHYEAHCVKRKM